MNTTQKADFISRYRAAITAFITALQALNTLQAQYGALDLGNVLVDADFTGNNSGITKAAFVAAVGSAGTMDTTFLQGHNTNMYKVIT
jgi:uncharacterized membrane protein